jgi:hypothetical protein
MQKDRQTFPGKSNLSWQNARQSERLRPTHPSATPSVSIQGKRALSSKGDSSVVHVTPHARCVAWLRRSVASLSGDAKNK